MRSLVIAATLAAASGKIRKSPNAELVENEWIVVMKQNATKADRASHIALLGDAQVLFQYDNVYTGYTVRVNEHVMERLSEHPDVEYVEQNGVVRAFQVCSSGPPTPPAGLWGLSRVSHRQIQSPLIPVRFNAYQGGQRATSEIYIMDTGLNYAHNEFIGGRAVFLFDATGEGQGDGNGHGTHCGGTAGGAQYGIAKHSSLFDIKVLNRLGSGTFAGVIAGIDFLTGRVSPQRVGSMSLGGGLNTPTNDAVNRCVASGALISIASGNGNTNACNTSPASARDGVTVNAIQNNDARAAFSNWGTCTHIFAPGVSVLSAWIGSNTATNTISGTSMACPHVTGILADMWAKYPGTTNEAIRQRLYAQAIPGVTNPGVGSPDRLAQTDCRLSPAA